MKVLKFLWTSLFVTLVFSVSAQSTVQPTDVVKKIRNHASRFPSEKVYLSFDKPYYVVGDTIWYKSILLNSNPEEDPLSDRIYIELFNDSSRLIERRVTPLENGLGYGEFSLPPNLKDGNYTIRAYSNWQQNFGHDYFFQQNFYIGNPSDKSWLLTAAQKLVPQGNRIELEVNAKLTNLKNEVAGYTDLEVSLMNDKKRIMRTATQTTQDGLFNFIVSLPTENLAGSYSLIIVDKKDHARKAIFPVVLKDVDQVDFQFMPEGGSLVNNAYSRVAFKIIGADGLGKNISGKIVDSQQHEISKFASSHLGMGSFYLLPKKDESYFAMYELAGKEIKLKLPTAKDEGTTLRIDHLSKKDSILVFIKASESKSVDQDYELVAQAGDSIVLALKLNLKRGFNHLKLPKDIFPDGIIHFTLFSPQQVPVNERNAFINLKRKIDLKINPTKLNFKPKDSVSVEIIATNENGFPLQGSFAVSVTDNSQVVQTAQQDNIISYYLLQSNLRGNIEHASWYFDRENDETKRSLDHLLLTQGWVGYQWDILLDQQKAPTFVAEKDNQISGKLTNLLGKPVSQAKVSLLSLGKNIFVTDTISNAKGEFIFKNLPIVDSSAFTIKIKNAKGKTSNARIWVNEFEPPTPILSFRKQAPWYLNSDSSEINDLLTAKSRLKQNERAKMALSGIALKEVEIKGADPKIKYSVAWDAALFKTITSEDLQKVPRKSLLTLLYETIPGFRTGRDWFPSCEARLGHFKFDQFLVGNNLIGIVRVDNISTSAAAGSFIELFDVNKQIFNSLAAQDIKEVRIYKGCTFYYLSIVTRGQTGPWVSTTPGVYVYRPTPVNFGRAFYSPKYSANKNLPEAHGATIFWDANVITNELGKTVISFDAAPNPGTYTIKIEGTDLLGGFGYKTEHIKIINKTSSK